MFHQIKIKLNVPCSHRNKRFLNFDRFFCVLMQPDTLMSLKFLLTHQETSFTNESNFTLLLQTPVMPRALSGFLMQLQDLL